MPRSAELDCDTVIGQLARLVFNDAPHTARTIFNRVAATGAFDQLPVDAEGQLRQEVVQMTNNELKRILPAGSALLPAATAHLDYLVSSIYDQAMALASRTRHSGQLSTEQVLLGLRDRFTSAAKVVGIVLKRDALPVLKQEFPGIILASIAGGLKGGVYGAISAGLITFVPMMAPAVANALRAVFIQPTASFDAIILLLDEQAMAVQQQCGNAEREQALAEIARARTAVAERRDARAKGTAFDGFCGIVKTFAGEEPKDLDFSDVSLPGKIVATGAGVAVGLVALPVGIARRRWTRA
jgi:hypothetical protein